MNFIIERWKFDTIFRSFNTYQSSVYVCSKFGRIAKSLTFMFNELKEDGNNSWCKQDINKSKEFQK